MHCAHLLSLLNSAWSGLSESDFDDSIYSVEFVILNTTTDYLYDCTDPTVPDRTGTYDNQSYD